MQDAEYALYRAWFWPCAGQNQFSHHIGSTYAPVQDDHITGFVTVSSGEMAAETIPKTLRRSLPSYPPPVLCIAPLAIDERFQGHGIGQLLLRAMLERALEMRNRVGCNARAQPLKPACSATLFRRYFAISYR